MSTNPKRRMNPRKVLYAAGICMALMIATLVVLRGVLHGPRLAKTIESLVNSSIRGSVHAESVTWPLSDVRKLVTGGWLQVEVHNLRVTDEFGDVVVTAPLVTLELDVHPAIWGRTFRLRNARLMQGGKGTLRKIAEPYPAHEYDTSVFSLVSAFYPKRTAYVGTGYVAKDGVTIDLQDFTVGGPGIELSVSAPRYSADLRGVTGGGFLFYDGADPLVSTFYYSLLPTTSARTADLVIMDVPVFLAPLNVRQLSQLPSRWPEESVPRDQQFHLVGTGAAGLTLEAKGAIVDSWTDIFGGAYKVTATAKNAGPLLALATGGLAHGANVEVQLDVEGSVLAPHLTVLARHLELSIPMGPNTPPMPLFLDHAEGRWDVATNSGRIIDAVATGAGGEIHASGHLREEPWHFDFGIEIPKKLDLGPYLPKSVVTHVGRHLSGSLYATGTKQTQRLERLDLRLGHGVMTGQAYLDLQEKHVHPDNVNLTLFQTRVRDLRGVVNLKDETVHLEFKGQSADAKRWLRLFDLPLVVDAVRGRASVSGTFSSPKVDTSLSATGVPVVGALDAKASYSDGRVRLHATSSAMGGRLEAQGDVFVEPQATRLNLAGQAVQLKLETLPTLGKLLTGNVDIEMTATGVTNHPRIQAQVHLRNWSVAKERFADTVVELRPHLDGQRLSGTLTREAGGTLHADVLLDRRLEIDGALSLRSLPVDKIVETYVSEKIPVGGSLSAEVQVGGSLTAPTVDGSLHLLRSWFRDSFLGTAGLQVEPLSDGRLHIAGYMFQQRIFLDGFLSTKAPYATSFIIGLRRVEIDRVFPELAKEHKVRGWVTGTVKVEGNLLGIGASLVRADFTEAEFVVERENADGRPAPIRVSNRTPIHLTYDGNRFELLERVVLRGPAGDFEISGSGTSDDLDMSFSGVVDVRSLETYAKGQFDDMAGSVLVSGELTGTIVAPRVTGVLQIQNVRLKPKGQDAIVQVPSGKIEFDKEQLTITGVAMSVKDPYTDDSAELSIGGGIRLKDLSPELWSVNVNGSLSGTMLLVGFPKVFSSASGSAKVSVSLTGNGLSPTIDGTLDFAPEQPLSVTPRFLRRDLTFTQGTVFFTDTQIDFEEVHAIVDGEGAVTIAADSQINIENWRLTDVDVGFSARDFPFRLPEQLDLTLNVSQGRVVLDERLEVSGNLFITNGRYVASWNPIVTALRPSRSAPSEPPVYERVPLLRNADLNLSIQTDAFFVDNNVAQLQLRGGVTISGSPGDPRFDGNIDVEQGSFKLQGVRARFERTTGSVRFSPRSSFPEHTPYLSIDSESDFRDFTGREHLVQLRIRGSLSQPEIDLSTVGGFNKAQTLALIVAARPPEDLRASVNDTAVGSRPGDFQTSRSTATPDTTIEQLDQVVKDFAGDWFDLLWQDRLRKLLRLDVARLQIGTASVGFYGELDATRALKLIGEIERTFQGWSWDVRGRYRLNDEWSLDGEVLQKEFDSEADDDVRQFRFLGTKTVELDSWEDTWRFFIP